MDGMPNRTNKAAFSNLSDVVWTAPDASSTLKQKSCSVVVASFFFE